MRIGLGISRVQCSPVEKLLRRRKVTVLGRELLGSTDQLFQVFYPRLPLLTLLILVVLQQARVPNSQIDQHIQR